MTQLADPDTEDSAPLDEFHGHEILDRSSILMDSWARHIVEHRWTEAHMKDEADAVFSAIFQFYQAVGRKTLE